MPNIDKNTQAAKNLYREVRRFSEQTKSWEQSISHQVTLDEVLDASLISQRVYGRRDEYLTIMAAAGIDTFDQPIPQKKLILPTEAQLYYIKRQAGFESRAQYRENGSPTWAK